MSDFTEFKRLNFFTGFFTTAKDWNEGEEYHLEKRRLHNRGLHTPGIIRDRPDWELEVKATTEPGLSVDVRPGAALDGEGNLIYLASPYNLHVAPTSGVAYITIKYAEQPANHVENVETPLYSGDTRVAEIPKPEVITVAPDNHTQLELARIQLDSVVDGKITDAHIDRSHAPWAGAVNPLEEQGLSFLRERLSGLHLYHLEKRRLHNRGLHTPGVVRNVEQKLGVVAAGGLNVRVLPGAALDGDGNDIYLDQERIRAIDPGQYTLPQLIYIAIEYQDGLAAYLAGSSDDAVETPNLLLTADLPDNQQLLELARIALQPGVTAISDPADPGNPLGNEIDRRYVVWAGSVGVAEEWLSPELQNELIALMQDNRRDFSQLAGRFPVPSVDDVRHALVTVEMLARVGSLRAEQLPAMLAGIAAIEQDVGQELGVAYPALVAIEQYAAYQSAVNALLAALRQGGQESDVLLTLQGQVAEAARELSEIILRPPTAVIANKQALGLIRTPDEEISVDLDASDSTAYEGRTIVSYTWKKTA